MTGCGHGYNPIMKPRRQAGIELLTTGAIWPTMTNVPWLFSDFDAFPTPAPVQSRWGDAE
jgi:hypothetical protein